MEPHRKRLGIVAAAAADVALDPDVGKEVHLDAPLPGPLAGLAAPAGDVEAETPRRVAAHLRLGKLGEQRADQVEDPGEGGRVRRGRLPQRLLIDADHLVDQLDAADVVVGAGRGLGAVQRAGQGVVEHVFGQRTLAAAAHAGDDGERAQRDGHVDVLEVVVACAADFQPAAGRKRGPLSPWERARVRASCFRAFRLARSLPANRPHPRPLSRRERGELRRHAAVGGHGDGLLAGEIGPGDGAAVGAQLGGGALGHDLTAQPPGPRAKVQQAVGMGDHLAVVLDQQQGVAQVAELLHGAEQAVIVAGMQPDGRLVEDIEHAAQPAADLGGQADALHFAAGERAGRPGQRQVVQAHVDEELDALGESRGALRRQPCAGRRRASTPAVRPAACPAAAGNSRRWCGRAGAWPRRRRAAGCRRRWCTRLLRRGVRAGCGSSGDTRLASSRAG